MKSPFPGMDPFLERHWQDVHSTFMVYAKQQLNEHLPAELLARVEESLAVETDDGHRRVVYPDIRCRKAAAHVSSAIPRHSIDLAN